MIRTRLRYHNPDSLDGMSALLMEHANSVAVLAGGTHLLPRMNRGEVQIEHVVDLRSLDLKTVTVRDGEIEIGARITYADVLADDRLRTLAPLLPRVARGVTGGRQILQQGTLIGALCFNFPGADMPGALVALGVRFLVHGPRGEREVAGKDFLLGAMQVDLRAGEFVKSVLIEHVPQAGYCKVKHSVGSWPIATASAVRDRATDVVTVTIGAVQAVPVQIKIDPASRLDEQINRAIDSPWSDQLAPGSYRAAIASVVARRALAELEEQERGI